MDGDRVALPKIVRNYENKYPRIVCIDKFTVVVPLTKVLPKRGTSCIKRIKKSNAKHNEQWLIERITYDINEWQQLRK